MNEPLSRLRLLVAPHVGAKKTSIWRVFAGTVAASPRSAEARRVLDRLRSDRYRVRWLQRCLDEKAMSMEDAVLIVGALSALGGPRHGEALTSLRAACGA